MVVSNKLVLHKLKVCFHH